MKRVFCRRERTALRPNKKSVRCKLNSAVNFREAVKIYSRLLFHQFFSLNACSVTSSCFSFSKKVQTLSGPASNINTPTLAHKLTNTPLAFSLSNSHIWSLSTPVVDPHPPFSFLTNSSFPALSRSLNTFFSASLLNMKPEITPATEYSVPAVRRVYWLDVSTT